MQKGWIGVDLDGTLARYDSWKGETEIGPPVLRMTARVKKWLAQGKTVKIFTARISDTSRENIDYIRVAIEEWCFDNLGQILEIVDKKDHNMIELWDDRVVQVIPNTGLRADGKE